MSERRQLPPLNSPLLAVSTSGLLAPMSSELLLSPSAVSDWNDDDVAYIDDEAAARAQVDTTFIPAVSFQWKIFWQYAGPGWLMSLAYLDPGNIEADLQSGAYAGYSLLWLLLTAHALGLLVQILAARIGVVTGYNLAELCRLEYTGYRRWVLWVMTELAIIGSDIQEVVGSAIAFQLLFGWPLWVGCIVTAGDSFTFLAIHFLGVRAFEAFVAVLIGTMAISFSADCFLARPPPGDVLSGFVPIVRSYAVLQAVGTLGSVIMPHNIFLHSALVCSRKIDRSNPAHIRQANVYNAAESALALSVSFFINAAIVCCFAKGFFAESCAVQSLACVPFDAASEPAADLQACVSGGGPGVCDEVGLSVAGAALNRLLPGSSAQLVWAIGLLAAGQSSTMTGTLAGQYVMEGFLSLRIERWKRTLLTRALALGPAVAVALMCEANPTVGDAADEWLNVLQSVQLPFAVLPLVLLTNDERIMGQFANRGLLKYSLSALVLTIVAVNVYLVTISVLSVEGSRARRSVLYTIVVAAGFAYFTFLYQLLHRPAISAQRGTLSPHANGAQAGDLITMPLRASDAIYARETRGRQDLEERASEQAVAARPPPPSGFSE